MHQFPQSQEGQKFIQIPLILHPAHQAAHVHLVVLAGRIAFPVDPAGPVLNQPYFCCPFNQSSKIKLQFPAVDLQPGINSIIRAL
jgi:hypothetical protein